MQRSDADAPPGWLNCKRPLIPDMIARDPLAMPVWEITGAEFTKSAHHTADGLSIRFPRITRQRDDKSPEQATSVQELQRLYEASKECTDVTELLTAGITDSQMDEICIETKMQKVGGSPTTKAIVKQMAHHDDDDNNDAEMTGATAHKAKVAQGIKGALKRRSDEVDSEPLDVGRAVKKSAKLSSTNSSATTSVHQQSSSKSVTKASTAAPLKQQKQQPSSDGSDCTKAGASAAGTDHDSVGRRSQQKQRYKYQDSSDENDDDDADNDDAAAAALSHKDGDDTATDVVAASVATRETKTTAAKIPDMFGAAAAVKAARAAKTNTLRAGAGGAGASSTSAALQLVDRQIGSDFEAANRVEVRPENNGVTATTATADDVSMSTSTPSTTMRVDSADNADNDAGPSARNRAINIFEGVVLCVLDGSSGSDGDDDDGGDHSDPTLRDRVREELRYFQLWGGRVVWADERDGAAGREDDKARAATLGCTHALHRAAAVRLADWTQQLR